MTNNESITASAKDVGQGIELVSEKGRRPGSDEALYSQRRLFVQLLAFGGCSDIGELGSALEAARLPSVLYEDLNDPSGIALLCYHESPDFFLDSLRPFLGSGSFARLLPKPEYTMFGRTYSMGWESDLDEALIDRPRSRLADASLRWALWYPLRRSGSFERLDEKEQRSILAEHGRVGQAFGRVGIAHDIRLACHGLGKEDNDFVIGVLAAELYPLSAIVQRMRKTKQTSTYIERLGPFFVGRTCRRGGGG